MRDTLRQTTHGSSGSKILAGLLAALWSASVGTSALQDALNSKYYCVGVRGRYAFELSADSEGDINAVVGAQYQLLAGF